MLAKVHIAVGLLILSGVGILMVTGSCSLTQSDSTQHANIPMAKQTNTQSAFEGSEVMNKMTVMEQCEMYWKFFFEKGEKIPREPLPQQQVQLSALLDDRENVLKATWLGHSSVLINIDGYTVLTDPVFERKVSPIGPTRFNKVMPLPIGDVPAVDVVIISHDHYDHLNKFSVQQLADKAGVFIVPLGVGRRIAKWGVAEEKIVEIDWWEESHPLGDLKIIATPARHFSGRGLFDRNSTLWASWVIQTPGHRVFFSGDTGYFDGLVEIGKQYGPFDVTFLECGAYNEHWANIHMSPEQTVQAFFDLGGKVLQPIHFATFNLALHPWYEPLERLRNAARKKGAQVATPVMGQVTNYEHSTAENLWWVPAMERSRSGNAQPEMAAHLSQ